MKTHSGRNLLKLIIPKFNKLFNRYLAVLCWCFFSTMLHAETDEESMFLMLSGDEELISLATGTPRPVSKAPAVASVITSDDILKSGAMTLEDILERVPGLHIIPSSGKQQAPTYSFRGINTTQGPQTLFLMNGKDITFLMTGGLHFGIQMPVQNIEKIEVIRGPGSAVYGADAFAGVINIITKNANDINGISGGLKFGSFSTKNAWLQYGKNVNDWDVAIGLEYRKTDGDSNRIIESDLQTILDGIFGTEASKAPASLDTRYDFLMSNITISKAGWTFHFNSWNGDAGIGAGIANALDSALVPLVVDQYQTELKYIDSNWLPNWSLETSLSYMYSNIEGSVDIFPDGAVLPIGTDGNAFGTPFSGFVLFPDGYIGIPARVERTTRFDNVFIFSKWKHHNWRFNVGVKSEDFRSSERKNFGPGVIDGSEGVVDGTLTDVTGTEFVYIPSKERTIAYLSVQDEWTFSNDWQLIVGVRYDEYSDVGGTTNPRASLIWNTNYNLTSKLLYGRAFRAPSFAELYAQNNPVATGNQALSPEVINSYELVFDYKPLDNLGIIFNIFHYEIDGLIDFVDDDGLPGGDATAQNNIDQKADGFELELKWQISKNIRLFGSTAYQDSTNKNLGSKVADTPRKQWHIGGNWSFAKKWNSQLDAFAIIDRPRTLGDPRTMIDNYNWVNLTFNANKLFSNVNLQLAIKNLFDSEAFEPGPIAIPNDYPLEGRSFYLGISSEF